MQTCSGVCGCVECLCVFWRSFWFGSKLGIHQERGWPVQLTPRTLGSFAFRKHRAILRIPSRINGFQKTLLHANAVAFGT